jgi:hypothetical protein
MEPIAGQNKGETFMTTSLRWAPESTFDSPELYRLHVVQYYSEVSDDAAYLQPVIQVLRNQTHYPTAFIKACEGVVKDYFNTLPLA